jgi:PRC-barrel domain
MARDMASVGRAGKADERRTFSGGRRFYTRASCAAPKHTESIMATTASGHTTLIASDKVEGTAVYNRQGEKLGSVYNLMIDKMSGEVEYANLSFGGLFGIGSSLHPLPWDVLDYDEQQGGYVVDLDPEMLKNAPSYDRDTSPAFDQNYNRGVNDYYGVGTL